MLLAGSDVCGGNIAFLALEIRVALLLLLSNSGSDSKESACNAGDLSSIPGWGRSPGEGNGYPL